MAATTTKLGIINRGLQINGMPQIASLAENSVGAKAMLRAYDSIRLAELRANVWKFAIKRANLAAASPGPIHGKSNYYPVPGDFVRLAPEENAYGAPMKRDWEMEGLNIVSSDAAPLPIRYVSSSVTESDFDVLFAECMSARLAVETCEELTNSNSKRQNAERAYMEKLRLAKRTNAIESAPVKSPTCSWITARE